MKSSKSLQLRSTASRAQKASKPASKPKPHSIKPLGVFATYAGLLWLPPGFRNVWNSCYVNSILHCTFGISTLRRLCKVLIADHPETCTCNPQGKQSQHEMIVVLVVPWYMVNVLVQCALLGCSFKAVRDLYNQYRHRLEPSVVDPTPLMKNLKGKQYGQQNNEA